MEYLNYDQASQTAIKDKQLTNDEIKTLVKLMKNRPMLLLKVSDICPNWWNINEMGQGFRDSLDAMMRDAKIGQIAPIIVTDNFPENPKGKEKYIIVDGYHRWLTYTLAGMTDIMAIYLKGLSQDEAKFITLMQNRVRGKSPDIKIYEALKGIDASNLHLDIFKSINIQKIETQDYRIPEQNFQPITPQTLDIKVTQHKASPQQQKEYHETKQQVEHNEYMAKENLNETMQEIRTLPMHFFPTMEQKTEIEKLLDKIKEQDKLTRREDALLFACRCAADIRKREAVIAKHEAMQEKAEKRKEKGKKMAEKENI